MKRFTLSLEDNAAERIEKIVAPYEGSVPGFASTLATDFSKLPLPEQQALREHIANRIMQLAAERLIEVPKVPGAPTQPQGATKTLLAQVESPSPQARTRPVRQGKRNAQAAELHAVT